MHKFLLILTFAFNGYAFSQLPNGSVAPDFTLTDYDGNTHNLYAYLNAGKTVYVEIFAAHCPSCWAYHQTERLKNIYNLYGPNGTDELMVFALEYDQYNDSLAFMGVGDPWVTAGDWLAGTPYPQFNVEGSDRSVFSDYAVSYYPLIYKICPDKLTEMIPTTLSEAGLYQKVQDCPALSNNDEIDLGDIYFVPIERALFVEAYNQVELIHIVNMSGQVIKSVFNLNSSFVDLNDLNTGVYIFQIQTRYGQLNRRLFVE